MKKAKVTRSEQSQHSWDAELEGAVCIVTGGARGIGRAIAEWFLDLGATVHVWDVDAKTLAAWRAERRAANPALILKRVDVQDGRQVARALRGVKRVDALVNNAARPFYCLFPDLTRSRWEKAMGDVHGAFEVTHQVLSRLKRSRQPSIINITSIEAFSAEPGTVAYGTAKGGLQQFTRSLAVDLGGLGIRVNSIAPGATVVERNRELFQQPKWKKFFKKRIPLHGKPGEADDIARAAVFLASPLSRYMTGATLMVDGGWSCLL